MQDIRYVTPNGVLTHIENYCLKTLAWNLHNVFVFCFQCWELNGPKALWLLCIVLCH